MHALSQPTRLLCGGRRLGVASSGWIAAEKITDGRIVHIPLYDPDYSGKNVPGTITISEGDSDTDPDLNVCKITDSHSGGNEAYYIDELLCLQVGVYHEDEDKWITAGYLRAFPVDTKTAPAPVIVGTIPCTADHTPPPECFTAPGWTTGDPANPGDVKAVSLIE